MSRKHKQRILNEEVKRVADVSTLVMWHSSTKILEDGSLVVEKTQRCPFCFSRQMRILDYDLAEGTETRYGTYKFIKKCKKCGGRFKTIVDFTDDGSCIRRRNIENVL